jgi:hypothetical protein
MHSIVQEELLSDSAPSLPGFESVRRQTPSLVLVFGDMVSPDRSQAI